MFKFLKSVYKTVKQVVILALLVISGYILIRAVELETAYTSKYENAYNQMVMEHDRNMIMGTIIRSQRSWERSNERMGIAYLDERAAHKKASTELSVQMYEQYTFRRVLEQLYPGAVEAVYEQLGPLPTRYPPLLNPHVLITPEPQIELQLTPEGHHAN